MKQSKEQRYTWLIAEMCRLTREWLSYNNCLKKEMHDHSDLDKSDILAVVKAIGENHLDIERQKRFLQYSEHNKYWMKQYEQEAKQLAEELGYEWKITPS